MQLCALDSNDHLVFAAKALKQRDYQCLECRDTVRLRSGLHRQPHFYHVLPNGRCRLHAKGLPHLMLQYHLKSILPEGEVEMECRFPTIGRIADIAWHSKKIVFEVQCSPISAEEVMERNNSYASAGYRVVWILHEQRYNQLLLSAAEDVLSAFPHYYSNMNELGEGMIYDQFACVKRGMRIFRLPKFAIDPSSPYARVDAIGHKLPKPIREREKSWSLGFSGDLLDRLRSDDMDQDLMHMVSGMRNDGSFGSLQFNLEYLKALFHRWVAFPYRILLRFMLERACR